MKSSNLKRAILKIVSSPYFYLILWLFYLIILILNTPASEISILFSIAALLLISHVLYGGYFLFKHGKILDTIVAVTSLGVLAGLFFFAQTPSDPKLWFIALAITFAIALVYHYHTKKVAFQKNIKEFCKYKMRIEIEGIIQSGIGYILSISFPEYLFWIGTLNILTILKINYSIILEDKLYKKTLRTS